METSTIRRARRGRLAEVQPVSPAVEGQDGMQHRLARLGKSLDRIIALTGALMDQSEALREGSLRADAGCYKNALHLAARLESTKHCAEDARQMPGAFEERLIGFLLNERMFEEIGRLRWQAALVEQLRLDQPAQLPLPRRLVKR